eukprot:TRINITY_DN5681_c1_g1_i1.p1 TRINITY_DN5681_c1_g1~~TRINITY_DN5681_c1_g1_i1.p1  ORF type:complete len:630 (-),score=158.98 TRINITY_DN5681_c1_g1_i1:162-2051(-)
MRRAESFVFQLDELSLELEAEVNVSPFKDQINEVKEILKKEKLIARERLDTEVDWYYTRLGIDVEYFRSTPPMIIARHILSLYSAKMVSHATGNKLQVQLHNRTEGSATFITPSAPGSRDSPAVSVEHTIEAYYLGEGLKAAPVTGNQISLTQTSSPPTVPTHGYRVACYRSKGSVSSSSPTHLRLYFLNKPEYPLGDQASDETDLQKVGDIHFWERSSENTKTIYQQMMIEAVKSLGPVIRAFQQADPSVWRLVVAYKRGSTHSYWSGISDLYHFYGLYSTHKYVEQFANGMTILSIYLRAMDPTEKDLTSKVHTIAEQASLVYILPRSSLTPLLTTNQLSAEEVAYAYVGWKFAYQFLNRYATEYAAIVNALSKDTVATSMFAQLRSRLTKDTFTEGRVKEAIMLCPSLIKDLYADFEKHHDPNGPRLPFDKKHGHDLKLKIAKTAGGEMETSVFETILTFNRYLVKTNFFQKSKVALSFRLDPSFLNTAEYAEIPYAMFFVVGSEFRGFHVRFRDIARGGIRIIRSINQTAYDQNSASVFDENYNLASTQQAKNKDIPEGGSKGTILLGLDHQTKADVAFRKYIDGLLDLLLPSPKEVVDNYGKEEILFLGPDEGTADFMDWVTST